MVKNTTGGKHHKGKKNALESHEKEIPFCQEGQEYAIVTKMLGDRRVTVLNQNRERIATIPKKLSGNNFWAAPGSLVLLNIRDYQDAKADVAYIYNSNEKKRLEKIGELIELIPVDKSTQIETNDGVETVDFEEEN